MLNAVMETQPNGRRLRVARLGSGPPMVLLHGYPTICKFGASWRRVSPAIFTSLHSIGRDWVTAMVGREAQLPNTWRTGSPPCSIRGKSNEPR